MEFTIENERLTEKEIKGFVSLIKRYSHCSATSQSEVTTANNYEFDIELQKDELANHPPSRMNPHMREIENEEVDKLLNAGKLEHSSSPQPHGNGEKR